MKLLLKNELKYHLLQLLIMTPLLIGFTFFALFLIITKRPFETIEIYSLGVMSLISYLPFFTIWVDRTNENRNRIHALLPITKNDCSISRFWFVALPSVIIIFYLTFIHLLIFDVLHRETGLLIGFFGVYLILISGFIRGKDDWFSNWNFGKRTQAAFVATLIIQALVVFLFLGFENMSNGLVGIYGKEANHFAKLIFPLLGIIILISTIYSFRKRKSYLS